MSIIEGLKRDFVNGNTGSAIADNNEIIKPGPWWHVAAPVVTAGWYLDELGYTIYQPTGSPIDNPLEWVPTSLAQLSLEIRKYGYSNEPEASGWQDFQK